MMAIPDTFQGLMYMVMFFGIDVFKYPERRANIFAALAFFLILFTVSISQIVYASQSEVILAIKGYHFYRSAERFNIYMSMTILSGEAMLTMLRHDNRLFWISKQKLRPNFDETLVLNPL